ncbi:MAG TPA: BON domain-containing protein [Gemmatimonadaceae bacterium]|jgi:osmotically-inducible protein OsmY|nr:BON domain-containing protein [Gemmatimonadaceae bacterium]
MKKTDTQLQADIIDELRFDPRVGISEIGVAAHDGVVTLTGKVESFAKKFAAARAAARVACVRAVANELTVSLLSSFTFTDTDIAHMATSALKWDVEVPDDSVLVRVEQGWVWLDGEVEWRFQSDAAERAIRNLSGVKGVTNLLKVRTHTSPADVKDRIERALKRHAEVDSKQINVAVSNGRVTLKGKVRSWTERQDVESAAWAAPGVTEIDDQLLISV